MKLRYLSLACILSVITFLSCQGLPVQQVFAAKPDLKDDTVLPGPGITEPDAVPIEIAKVPSEKIREALEKAFPETPIIYLTTIEHVKPAAVQADDPATPSVDESKIVKTPVIIPLTPPTKPDGGVDFGTWLGQAAPAIGTLVPVGAAPWIPLAGYLIGLLGNKRSRNHLKDAASELNPLDEGYVDIGAAKSSVAKAIGWSHSTQSPAELRALADKLEMEQKMDAKLEDTKKV